MTEERDCGSDFVRSKTAIAALQNPVVVFGSILAFSLMVNLASAAEDYDEEHGYVQLMRTASGEVSAFNAPDENTFWSDGLAPHSETNYFVPSKHTFYTPTRPGEAIRWAGGQLVVGGTFWHVSNTETTFDDLVVLGYKESFRIAGTPGPLSGRMTVLGTTDSPSTFHHFAATHFMEMKVAMVGDEGAVFRCALKNAGGGFSFSGDCRAYRGTLIFDRTNPEINNEDEPVSSTAPKGYTLATSFPGTLKVCGESRLIVTNDATVGALDLGAETTLVYGDVGPAAGTCLTVTGLLTVSGRPKIVISSLATDITDSYSRPLLKFNAGSDVTVDDFDITVKAVSESLGVHDYAFEVASSADGGAELRVVKQGVTEGVVTINDKAVNGAGYSAFSTAQDVNGTYYWSDEGVPDAGKTYVVDFAKATSLYLPTGCEKADVYQFPGEALYLRRAGFSAAGSTSSNKGGGISAARLYWCSGTITIWNNQGTREPSFDSDIYWFRFCGGTLYTFSGWTITSLAYNSQGLMFESEVRGSGTFEFSVTKAGLSTGRRASFLFTQDNTNFTGRIYVSAADPEDKPATCATDGLPSPSDDSCLTLFVTNGLSLGGACKSFVYDGLKLERYARLVVRKHDVELAGGLNRGVLINGTGRFVVEPDLTLTVSRPITVNGRLRKEGTGTLALGGELRFTDGAAETLPTADKNVVRIEEGTLRLENARSLDGAAVAFAADTKLVIKEAAMEGELAEKGLLNTKGTFAAARLTSESLDGKLAVELDASALPPCGNVSFGLVTVPTEDEAKGIKDRLAVTVKASAVNRKFRLTGLEVKQNADATWTVSAACTDKRTGMALVYR